MCNLLLAFQGELELALQHYQRALTLQPNNYLINQNLQKLQRARLASTMQQMREGSSSQRGLINPAHKVPPSNIPTRPSPPLPNRPSEHVNSTEDKEAQAKLKCTVLAVDGEGTLINSEKQQQGAAIAHSSPARTLRSGLHGGVT